ncbi:MAG: VOC family protein [Gammaproteobacteria bacterium]|nr:VOC family protein [Gammaproteobacteria bacterium]
MISHLTLGTNDLAQATQYYDQVFAIIGARLVASTDSVVFYAFPDSPTKLAITKPFNGEKATFGNGTMLALRVASEDKVKELYKLAMQLNSKCEGEPAPRDNRAYFAAYFRDLDGNKIAVFHRSEGENA